MNRTEGQISVYTESELKVGRKWPRHKLLEEVETVRQELDLAKRRMERFNKHVAKHGWRPRGYEHTETEIKLREADLAMLKKELNRR